MMFEIRKLDYTVYM